MNSLVLCGCWKRRPTSWVWPCRSTRLRCRWRSSYIVRTAVDSPRFSAIPPFFNVFQQRASAWAGPPCYSCAAARSAFNPMRPRFTIPVSPPPPATPPPPRPPAAPAPQPPDSEQTQMSLRTLMNLPRSDPRANPNPRRADPEQTQSEPGPDSMRLAAPAPQRPLPSLRGSPSRPAYNGGYYG